MNNLRKLFVFDLDGTLLNSHREISEENYNALEKAKAKGHLLAIATGRNYIFAKKVLNKHWNTFDFYLGCNAAVFHNIKINKYYNISLKISYELANKISEQIKKIGGGVQVSTVWKIYANFYDINKNDEINDEDRKEYFNSWLPIEKMSDKEKDNIMQISVFLDSSKVLEFHKKWILEYGNNYDFSITSKNNIDINVKNINKLFGIKHIAKNEFIPFNNIYVFGDSQNDIPSILYYNNTYAMSNGLQEVKNIAKEVIGNNDTNSIAQIITKNI